MKTIIAFLCALSFFSTLSAADIFINGVKVPTLKNQSFKGCEVTFDEKGNIHIKAPGIEIVPEDQLPPKESYFINMTLTKGILTNPVTVFVNGNEAGFLSQKSTTLIKEITQQLRKGKNNITLVSQKSDSKISFQIIAGKGKDNGGNLTLTPIIDTTKSFGAEGLSEQLILNVE